MAADPNRRSSALPIVGQSAAIYAKSQIAKLISNANLSNERLSKHTFMKPKNKERTCKPAFSAITSYKKNNFNYGRAQIG
jgi:hypothetical protein